MQPGDFANICKIGCKFSSRRPQRDIYRDSAQPVIVSHTPLDLTKASESNSGVLEEIITVIVNDFGKK